MHILLRNIKWDSSRTTLTDPETLPKSVLIKNAIDEHEAKSSALIHFDAEVEEATCDVVTEPTGKLDVERVVFNA